MSKARFTPLDVYTILPQSNCGQCLLPSCLAFAAAIVAGSRKLTILFDACCSTNLHIKSLFTLCSGLVQMFAKIAEHHR